MKTVLRLGSLGVLVVASISIWGCSEEGPRLEGEATVDSVLACLEESSLVNDPVIDETSSYFGPIRLIVFDFNESQATVVIGVNPGDPEQAQADVEAAASDPSLGSSLELAPNNDEVTVSTSDPRPSDAEMELIDACTTEAS